MTRFLSAFLGVLVVSSGCIDGTRVNSRCDWTGDSRFPIDPRNTTGQQHLVADAQLAEELAIRYADAEHKRLFGYEGHGGLIAQGRVRNECMARLVALIENNHAVGPEQIAVARGVRNPLFDAVVALSFLPFYCAGAAVICVVLRRRFSSDEGLARSIVTGLTSVAASFLGLQLGQLWGALWEMRRVGNGHISSFRTATRTLWIHERLGEVFVGGVLLFWIVALVCYRRSERRAVSADSLRASRTAF